MLPESLGLLHLAVLGASIFRMSRAVAGAVRGAVGGAMLDAVGCSMADPVAGSVFIAFAILVGFPVLVALSVCISGGAVLVLALVLLWQTFALHVSLDPEVGEEDEEEGSVHPDEVDDCWELVAAAVHEVILGGVEGYEDKLDLPGEKETNV